MTTYSPNLYFFLESKHLRKCRNLEQGRLIGYKTRIRRTLDSVIIIAHHNTDILKFQTDGTMTVNNGGWNSRTTNRRLNKFSHPWVYFFCRKGVQLVDINDYWFYYEANMKITKDLKVIGAKPAPMPKKQRMVRILQFLRKLDITQQYASNL